MGAYTIASATSFNGFAPPRTIVLHNEKQFIEENLDNKVINKRPYQYAAMQMQ
jgi:hypothetical protein